MSAPGRRTKAEMEELRRAIVDLASEHHPCTVRQLYYLGIGRWWSKDTGGKRRSYREVVRLTGELREAGELPWGWIADNTRWVRRDQMHDSIEDALQTWAGAYRRDLWTTQPLRVEVWCESDSIAGVLHTVTRPEGLGLFVCRGQASKTFVHEAVQTYEEIGKPVVILYVGDWDPTGLAIPLSLADRIDRYGNNGPDVELIRVAVTSDDVASGRLVTHDVNGRDTNYRRFAEHARLVGLDPQIAVEVEALPPEQLRRRLRFAIDGLVQDVHAWNVAITAEESERELLRRLAEGDTRSWR